MRYPTLPTEKETISAFYRSLEGSGTTRHFIGSAVRAFYHGLSEMQVIPEELYLQVVKVPIASQDTVKPTPLTLPQVHNLLAKAPTRMHRAIIYVFLTTGIRRVSLQSIHTDFLTPTRMRVRVKKVKGGPPHREVGIVRETYKVLRELAPPGGGYIFHGRKPSKPLDTMTITHMVQECFDAAGLGIDRAGPHLLRHTMGAFAKRSGGLEAAKEILGHATIKMTADTYSGLGDEWEQEKLEEAVESMGLPDILGSFSQTDFLDLVALTGEEAQEPAEVE